MKYYLLSIKWTYRGDFALKWWGKNSSGYSIFKNNAGLYEKEKAFSISKGCHWSSFPIPQKVVDDLWTEVIYEPKYSPQEGKIVINNRHTRGLLRIDPFIMEDECRIDHTCFIIKSDCLWLNTFQEEYSIVKTDVWDIIIKEPVEPCEFSSMGEVKGKNYREARKNAFKEIDYIYSDMDFIKTMSRFKVVRQKKKVLVNPICPKSWEDYK